MAYSEKVMDHFQHPRNVGEIENASGVGTVGNAKCGDIMRIYLDIDDNGVIPLSVSTFENAPASIVFIFPSYSLKSRFPLLSTK